MVDEGAGALVPADGLPTGYEDYYGEEEVEEISLESVGLLVQMVASKDVEARDEALAIMCELVGSCYGEDGMAVGAKVRESGGPLTLSWLLAEESVSSCRGRRPRKQEHINTQLLTTR